MTLRNVPIQLLRKIGVATAMAMLVSILGFAAPALAEPALHIIERGHVGYGQGLSSLAGQELAGTQDQWANYIEFIPDSSHHASLIDVAPSGAGQDLRIDLNYRGPESSENLWRLQVRDFENGAWVEVFSNDSVDEWVWHPESIDLENSGRFLRNGRVRFAYFSSNSNDVSQLDYLAVALSSPRTPPAPRPPATPGDYELPPIAVGFDYQINGHYTPAAGVGIVSRDWAESPADPNLYSVCYVNAFQTQPAYDSDRADQPSQWPAQVVSELEDPNWPGEFLIDISSAENRAIAAQHMEQILDTCSAKGYDAVEFDNLDSWTRNVDSNFDGTASNGENPWWDIDDATAYARLLTTYTHTIGMAAAQKNTTELFAQDRHVYAGFDFAVSENCGQWNECGDYVRAYGRRVYDIEYTTNGFSKACYRHDNEISIVRRDLYVEAHGVSTHVYTTC